MKKTLLCFVLLGSFSLFLKAQQPTATPADQREKGFETRKKLSENSLLGNIPFRCIGPTVQSGRVVDVDVNPQDPSIFYVAYASGGLWKTESNGSSFKPMFDQESVITIGDIAVDWKRNVIWVGSGEVNSSRSSYAGNGIYKSEDEGKTWRHMGLPESHHIGRVILHPNNPDVIWVAALGHLYSPNKERGIYKTIDGGKTWTQTLFVDENTGAVDLVIDPDNPDILYASTWHRERTAWNFVESGEGSGIYKSIDGGNTWVKSSAPQSGFPSGEGVGRIGLALSKNNGKQVLYAVVDNQNRRPKELPEEEEDNVLTKDQLKKISREDFLKLDKQLLSDFLKNNNFPEKYKAEEVFKMVKEDKILPIALVEYLEDANSLLFDTEVIGAEVYRSDDEGLSWKKTHQGFLDGLFFSYGYYFAQIRVAKDNPDKIYLLGLNVIRSDNGGKKFISLDADNVHSDHHALWVDPNRAGHLINGNDGGVNISYDDGKSWFKCNTPPVGQFYGIAVDDEEPYNVYGGLQDNGVWTGPSYYKPNTEWQGSGQYPFKSIMGGDGMQVMVDPRDNATVYTGFQFGNYYRINKNTGDAHHITPYPDLGERPLRFNWQTPIWLSVHNADILYFGANKLYRSLSKGDRWECISKDLTKGGKKGDVPYGTITTISESPLKFGLIYTGSDDGMVYVSKDGGNNWSWISAELPQDRWVSRVIASAHDLATVYVSLSGYRWDDFNAYLYVSHDYGNNWNKIGEDLPAEPINVVKEDPNNKSILYVGTDHGLYVSLNSGKSFMPMTKNFPSVPVHDLAIQPKAKELVVGTHGRSMYIASVEQLEQLSDSIQNNVLFVFGDAKKKYSRNWGKQWDKFTDPEGPTLSLPVFSNTGGNLHISVKTEKGLVLKSFDTKITKGINYPEYDLSFDENMLLAYEKGLNETKEDKASKTKKKIVIKKADTGLFYLYKGKYTLSYELNGVKIDKDLVIE